ncbi:hypothetical protein HYH02_011040 [Chlamydomonas schloesseri]|uniref:Uncharacterized protein n=1 Tax=Chlamydomonas schloesseri TaxID=2026947 RepID=A0A835TC50_9CHLO|nr:hypothetical protein HYH02_011040 [Chlamydomonas schloesseri]|eukprot:KAG2437659.1 hypothetical protein HYH02_011040 [Chlamydomonas schloesseri]
MGDAKRRANLLCLAASSHHAASLEAALAHCGVGLASAVFEAAAAAGDLGACQRLLDEGCDIGFTAVQYAAFYGHLHVLQWIWEAGFDDRLQLWQALMEWEGYSHALVAEAACAGGQGHVLAWIETGPPPPHAASAAAVASSNRAQAQGQGPRRGPRAWAEERYEPPLPFRQDAVSVRGMVSKAARGGHAQLMRRLLDGPSGRAAVPRWTSQDFSFILQPLVEGVAPVEVLQQYYEAWVPQRLRVDSDKDRAQLLSMAVSSLSSCWEAKAELLLSRWEEEAADAAGGPAGAAPAAGRHRGGQRPQRRHQRQQQHQQQQQQQQQQNPVERIMRELGKQVVSAVTGGASVWRLPDFARRWRFLAGRGLPDGWQVQAAKTAAQEGNCVALAELLDGWAAPKAGSRGGSGPDRGGGAAAAAAKPWPGLSLIQELGEVAVRRDQLAVLRMLRERYGHDAVKLGLKDVKEAATHGSLVAVRYLAEALEVVEGPRDVRPFYWHADEVTAADAEWEMVFNQCAAAGADESLLGLLVQQRGVPVELPVMVKCGSVQSMDWALGLARAQKEEEERRRQVQRERGEAWGGWRQDATITFTMRQLWLLVSRGNLAAAAWLLDRGLLNPPVSSMPHPADFLKPGYDYQDEFDEVDDGFGGFTTTYWPDHKLEPPLRRRHTIGYIRLWVTRNSSVPAGAADASVADTAGAAGDGGGEEAGGMAAGGAASSGGGTAGAQQLVEQWDRLLEFLSTFREPHLLPHQLEWLKRRRLEVVKAFGMVAW